jgi:thioredoxin reductase (NADPH)
MSNTPRGLPLSNSRLEQIFPKLTPAQINRIAVHGHMRTIQTGEVLVEQGDTVVPFFVVVSGEIEIVRPSGSADTIHGPGEFTGEVNMLSGRRTLVRMRATKPGEVVELDRQKMMTLIQTDAELGEILTRAFILRRVELVAAGVGDIVLIGSIYSAGTHRIKEFLMRNGHPYSYIDLERDPDVQKLLDSLQISASEVPVLVCRGQVVLRNPSNHQIANCLGFNESVDQTKVRDLVVIGGGPSWLAAAVYGASEGLDVLVLETSSPGGQAGSSSRIENYLGFPTGISGQELAVRAYIQAQKFGAEILTDTKIKEIHRNRKRDRSISYPAQYENNKIRWIETLLQIPISDHRKYALWRIVAPYLINIKKLSYEDAFSIIREWLDKCDKIKPLDFSVNNRITTNLDAATKGGYLPIGFSHLKTQNRELADLISYEMKKE